MTHKEFVQRVIGVPFVPYGRSLESGLDCWGLVHCYYRLVKGVLLPGYEPEYAGLYEEQGTAKWRRLISIFERGTEALWKRLECPKTGDMALVYRRGLVIHIGLVMPHRRLLHVEEGVDTCQEPIERMRIEGFYALDMEKYKELTDAHVAE